MFSRGNADTHFVRACAVETHVKISQEPLYTEIYRKNAAAQIEPATQTHILRELAQAKRMSRFHRTRILCKPAQSKCTSTFAKRTFRTEEPLYIEIYRKNAATQIGPKNPSLGAHFVRARAVETHVKISQEPLYTAIYRKNAAAQSEHPDQAPAFTLTYRKNPSVWTHCSGKNNEKHTLDHYS